jgi:hypothetical protein
MLKDWRAVFNNAKFEITSFNNYKESLLKLLIKVIKDKCMPYIRYYKIIFKRFKLKPLYFINLIVYIYILIKIYTVIKTKGGRTLKLLVTTYYP